MLASAFPLIAKLPTKRRKLTKKLHVTMGEISNDLLLRSRREKDVKEAEEEKSIIGLLSMLSKRFILAPLLTQRSQSKLKVKKLSFICLRRKYWLRSVETMNRSYDLPTDILQMRVLLVAGYETTSSELISCLFP
jgi:hypothetical protein